MSIGVVCSVIVTLIVGTLVLVAVQRRRFMRDKAQWDNTSFGSSNAKLFDGRPGFLRRFWPPTKQDEKEALATEPDENYEQVSVGLGDLLLVSVPNEFSSRRRGEQPCRQ